MFYNKKVILLISVFSYFASNCDAMEYCIRKGLISDISQEQEKVNNVKVPNKKPILVSAYNFMRNSNGVSSFDLFSSPESIMERPTRKGAIPTSLFSQSTTTLDIRKPLSGANSFNSINVHNGSIKFNRSFFTCDTKSKRNNYYGDSEMKRIYQLKKLRDYETLLKKRDISSAIKLKSEIVSFDLDSEIQTSSQFSRLGELIRNGVRVLNLINKTVKDYDSITGDPGSYFCELNEEIRKMFGIRVKNISVDNKFTLDSIDKLKKLFEKSNVSVDLEAMLIRFPDHLESCRSDFTMNNA